MADIDIVHEAEAARERSESLIQDGCTAGTMEPSKIALYMAVSERVDEMSTREVVDLVRQGLSPEDLDDEEPQLRDLGRHVLLSVAFRAAAL